MIKDWLFRYAMSFGGVSVIIAITAIFFYLFTVVLPLFEGAELAPPTKYAAPGGGGAAHLAVEEQTEIGVRFGTDGQVTFFHTKDGALIERRPLLPPGVRPVSFAAGDPSKAFVAYGLADGRMVLARHHYEVSYPDDVRQIAPRIQFPLGERPLVVDDKRTALRLLTVQSSAEETTVVALTADGRIVLTGFKIEESLLGDAKVERLTHTLPPVEGDVSHLVLDIDQRELYVAHAGRYLSYFDVQDKSAPRLLQRVEVAGPEDRISALAFINGGHSVIVGTERGLLDQWFPLRDAQNHYTLQHVRDFDPLPGRVTAVAPEYFRKGFLATDDRGNLGLYYTTSQRTMVMQSLASGPLSVAAMAPRANAVLVESADGELRFLRVHNEHPEISFTALWGKVWYEGYPEPDRVWQSSAATGDFEPKFSLTPLSFGTLKGAFYAMLVSLPLAILGAIFTGYFMAPKMRNLVKPSIEVMEALPTVILGFLAGLWLAPFVETHLPGIFSVLVLLPVGILLAAYAWFRLPARWRLAVPEGWEAALLIPVVLAVGAFAVWASQPIEVALFGGDMPQWLSDELGIRYEQRNSLVVGLAMGFGVTPIVFSIAEDAIFSVPRHLTTGSLALGATPWHTLVNVVLLTASPGIFSAVMIGLGRAVGETMIVLMATGNTPVLDFSVFNGFRALSANIAVEMPEAEVDSTHYRVLFLAALVLFLFTFAVNTVAELVRQRLRRKYSNL